MKSNTARIAVPSVIILLFIVFQIYRLDAVTRIWVDEPWYSNTASNVAEGKGFENSLVGSGGGDEAFLYTLLLGGYFRLFGVSLFTARFFSVILGALTLLFLYLALNENLGMRAAAAGTIMAMLNSSLFVIFRTVRPEAAGIMFTAASLLFLLKERNFKNILIASTSAYCAFLSHPAFLSVPVSIGAILAVDFIMYRKKSDVAAFASASAVFAAVFLIFIVFVKRESPSAFFSDWSARTQSATSGFIPEMISKIKAFSKDYSMGIKRLFILVFETAAAPLILISSGKKNKKARDLSVFILIFIIFSFAVLSKVSLRYFTAVSLPVVLAAFIASGGFFRNRGKTAAAVSALLILYALNSAVGLPYLFYRERKTTPYSTVENKLKEICAQGESAATIINFWFPLRKMNVYNEYTRWEYTEYSGYEDLFAKNPPDFIVYSDYLLEGTATTSGRKTETSKTDAIRDYLILLQNECEKGYSLKDSFSTEGYGTVKVYAKN